VREKVNETLSKIAGGVAQLYRKSRGRVRIDLDKRVRKFHLFEIKSVQESRRVKRMEREMHEFGRRKPPAIFVNIN
jgi:hypothetical protein